MSPRARLAAAAALACLLAAGCGSDLHGIPKPRARPLRIAVLDLPRSRSDAWRGLADVRSLIGARRVALSGDPDVVVTPRTSLALRAARGDAGTRVLLLGRPAPSGAPSNLLGITWNRLQVDYLAGAVAALEHAPAAIAARGRLPAVAFARGSRAMGGGPVSRSGCAHSSAAIVYAPDPGCVPAGPRWLIAPRRLAGRRMLAVVGPRVDVQIFDAVRSVQNATFEGGRTVEWGLFEDALGVRWLAPSIGTDARNRLLGLEDQVRAGAADVPEP